MRQLMQRLECARGWGFTAALIGAVAMGFSACDSSASGQDGGNSVSYNAGASVGELLSYTLDVEGLTYSYRIVESQFGQTGDTGTGTLTKNEDGSYTPSGAPDTRVIVLPNGMLFGAETVTWGGAQRQLLYAGAMVLAGGVTPEEIAGTYNTIEYSCSPDVDPSCGPDAYFTSYGSLKINADGTFVACPRGDVDDQAAHPCEETVPGTWVDQGGGLLAAKVGEDQIGTAMVVPSSGGGRALVMDLRDVPPTTRGLMVGVRRVALAGQDLSGTYLYTGDDNNHGQVVVDSAQDRYTGTIWEPQQAGQDYAGSLTRDQPWTGWLLATDDGGETTNLLVLPGDGVFFNTSFTENSWLDIGGRL